MKKLKFNLKPVNKIFLFFVAFFLSCNHPEIKSKTFVFKNDFENIDGWYSSDGIIRADAHSGAYCISAIAPNEYSGTFKKKIKDVYSRPLRKITYSGWVKIADINCHADLVVSINEQGAQPVLLLWNSVKTNDFINRANTWTFMKGSIDISPTLAITENTEVGFYFWDHSPIQAFADDLQIELVF